MKALHLMPIPPAIDAGLARATGCTSIMRRGFSVHELKTDPEMFAAVWSGAKRAEYRRFDRRFEVHDYLLLRERVEAFGSTSAFYSGRWIRCRITHVLQGAGLYGMPVEFAMLSFRICGRGEDVR